MASSQPVKPPLASQNSQARGAPPGLRYPSNGKTIYHRPLNRSRTQELSQASFAYLFGEMVSYAQKRVTGIQDLEKRFVLPFKLRCYQLGTLSAQTSSLLIRLFGGIIAD